MRLATYLWQKAPPLQWRRLFGRKRRLFGRSLSIRPLARLPFFSRSLLRYEERRVGNAPFYQRYPYRGGHALQRIDRNTAIDLESGFIFHRIPRVANSTITASLVQYKTGDAIPSNHAAMKAVLGGFRHPSSLRAREVGLVDGLFKFVVVRNPYARLLSTYISKVSPHQCDKRRADSVSVRRPDWTSAPSFDTFCRYLAAGGLYYNAHWVPQVDFLLFPLERYDYIGHVESLENDFDAICARIFGGPGPYRIIGEDDNHATGAKSRLDEYYTDELYDLVYELYAADFEAFQYEKGDRP